MSERVGVSIEDDGRRRARENALSAWVLSRRQTIDSIARVVIDGPCIDEVQKHEQ